MASTTKVGVWNLMSSGDGLTKEVTMGTTVTMMTRVTVCSGQGQRQSTVTNADSDDDTRRVTAVEGNDIKHRRIIRQIYLHEGEPEITHRQNNQRKTKQQ